jgi:multiple sugar transport system permease protein/putative aldouronate transport system permease protein
MTTDTLQRRLARGRARRPGEIRRTARPAWEEPPTKIGQAGKGAVLTVVLLLIAGPLYSIVLTSFSPQRSVGIAGGLVVVPHGVNLNAYREILTDGTVSRSLLVTFGLTAVGTLFSMIVSVLCAYGLSRGRTFGHRKILMLMIVTMFFNGGLIPTFLVVNALGGYDQYWALVLPSAVSVFNILIMRGFYAATSSELIDAAKIDGAGEWRTLWSVVLPTTKAVSAVMALFYAVGYWNTFFSVLLYMPFDHTKWPMQYVLYQYVDLGTTMPGVGSTNIGSFTGPNGPAPLSLEMAVVVLTLLPILVFYPFVQKHFTKGVLTGAVKG